MRLHNPLPLLPVALFFIASSATDAAPKQYTIEQFMDSVSLRDASFSADESRILFSSNQTGVFNVYSVLVKGGPPTPITRSTTDSTYAVSYFPHDDRVLFTQDKGGDEQFHLYVLTKDGKAADLTPGKALTASFMRFSRDGDAFFVSSNERDPRFFDVYRYDAQTLTRKLLYKNTDTLSPEEVSPDGQWIALSRQKTTNDTDLFLWRADTSRVSHFTAHSAPALYKAGTFDPTSTFFYFLTNDGREFTRVREYGLRNSVVRDIQKADWDVTSVDFSRDGRYRLTTQNEDARNTVSILDTARLDPVKVPGTTNSAVDEAVFSPSGKHLALYLSDDRSPSDLYVFTLASRTLTRLTHSLNSAIDPNDLVTAQVVRFPSFDGLKIPNIFYKPPEATPAHKVPAIVWVHGGPGGQTTFGYDAVRQYLVNHGYVILGINNRGSSGYGKTFFAADDQKHGHEPLWDCVAARDYLAKLPEVDPQRIAIVGGSYGGYMVLAALAFKPNVFTAGVDMYGVSNWIRTLQSMPTYWEAERQALYAELGDPVRQREMLREISPLFHADQIRRPLLVLQGANDPRVIQSESDDIVAAVKKNRVPVEYIVFPDEGHGFTKKENQIKAYGATLAFLDKYVKGAQRMVGRVGIEPTTN